MYRQAADLNDFHEEADAIGAARSLECSDSSTSARQMFKRTVLEA